MSFPRAKRFNNLKDCTPSPFEYNVEIKEKPKCAIILQSDRFSDISKSPPVSEHGSVKSVPCFRTPTVMKKKKLLIKSPSTKQSKLSTKVKGLFSSNSADNNNTCESLREIMVECSNKDTVISELTEQLEEMKNKIATLENEKQGFVLQKQQSESLINELNNSHQKKLQETFTKHHDELKAIKNELSNLNQDLNTLAKHELVDLLKSFDSLKNLHKETIKNHYNELNTKNKLLVQNERELKLLEESCAEIQRKHALELEHFQKEHTNEVQDIEFEFLKAITEMQHKLEIQKRESDRKIKELSNEYKKSQEVIILECEARVRQLEENFKEASLLSEIQMRERSLEIEQIWKLKLEAQEKESAAILKECQAISEYNIIQSELEKNSTITKLAESEKELAKLMKDLKTYQNDYNKLLAERRTFEVTINTSQVTINVLKKRLINSDKDVEQLKNELQSFEAKLLNCEGKINLLTCEVERLELANEELDMQNTSTLKIAESEIQQIKTELLHKIDEYKKVSQEKIKGLLSQLELKERENETILSQLHEQQKLINNSQKLINDATEELERLEALNANLLHENQELLLERTEHLEKIKNYKCTENEIVSYKNKIKELENCLESKEQEINFISDLVEELQEKSSTYFHYYECYNNYIAEHENEAKEADEIRRKYIEQSGKYDELLEQFEVLKKENDSQKIKIQEQESLIGPFREQLEKFELQEKALMSEKEYMESEANQLRRKYAEILGHQNHRQKIRHLVDLKAKNEELAKSKLDLESKIRSHAKTIEKLKKENSDLKKSLKKIKPTAADKENIASPNRSLNSSRIDSPGPLRERN